jgi:DNA-binding transcriptional LysR family regulator
MKGLSLDRLNSFLAIADARGLARAAPGDPVRQSQLSRQLKELETALGRPLFLRTGRGMELTPAGRSLARVVRELSQGLTDVASAEAGPVRVSLGGGDSVLQWLVLPRLPVLEGLQLELGALGSDGVVSALQDHQIDLGLLRASEASGELKSVRLGVVTYALFSAVGRGKLPLAVPTTERGLTPAIGQLGPAALRCETFPQVAQAVRSGFFAGVLPTFARTILPAAQYRMTSHPALDSGATPLLLAWRARTLELRPQVRALRRVLEQVIRPALGRN